MPCVTEKCKAVERFVRDNIGAVGDRVFWEVKDDASPTVSVIVSDRNLTIDLSEVANNGSTEVLSQAAQQRILVFLREA